MRPSIRFGEAVADGLQSLGRLMLWASVALAAGSELGQSARAQSLNFDVDIVSGPGSNVPGPAFAGAAGVAGRWLSLPAVGAGPFSALATNGLASPVRVRRTGSGTAIGLANTRATGDYARLLLDLQNIPGGAGSTGSAITIENLAPGEYQIYTYAAAPDSTTLRSLVSIVGSPSPQQSVGGQLPMDAFTLGVTHSLHTFNVVSDQSVVINLVGGSASPATFSGLQIKQTKPGRLYVDAAAPSGGDGRSWATAYNDLPTAINNVGLMRGFAGGLGQPEVWIARGTYRINPTTAPTNRDAFLRVPDGVNIIGGFAGISGAGGGEFRAVDRSITINPTILTGNIGDASLTTDNTYGVVLADLATTATLDGLVIEGARDDRALPIDRTPRGGLTLASGRLRLLNTTIRGCASAQPGAGLNVIRGELEAHNCTFQGNVALRTASGAGTWLADGALARFSSCRWLVNSVDRDTLLVPSTTPGAAPGQPGSGGNGAAILSASSGLSLINCLIASNGSGTGGAVVLQAPAQIVNCTIAFNLTKAFTAGLQLEAEAVTGTTVRNSILWGNRARDVDQTTVLPQVEAVGVPLAQFPRAAFTNCIIANWPEPAGPFEYRGVRAIDPYFTNALGADGIAGTSDDDLSVRSNSPAIDAGDTDAYLLAYPTLTSDVLGNMRIRADLGRRRASKPLIDLGAIEQSRPACLADFTGDLRLDAQDLFTFLGLWFASDRAADADRSGTVTVEDLFIVINAWFTGC